MEEGKKEADIFTLQRRHLIKLNFLANMISVCIVMGTFLFLVAFYVGLDTFFTKKLAKEFRREEEEFRRVLGETNRKIELSYQELRDLGVCI